MKSLPAGQAGSGTVPSYCSDNTNTGNVLDFTYGFSLGSGNNGNVTSITNNINNARNQSFTYDELNRIKTAVTQATTGQYAWGLSFAYDPWANLQTASVTQGSAPALSQTALGNNRLSGYSYDAAGNMLSDGTNTFTYNAENQMTTAAGVAYNYDGNGNRVQKATINTPPTPPTPFKLYWYGAGSDPLNETDAAGNTNNSNFNEYLFFGGKRIARRDSDNNVNYYFSDHLGTARVVTNSTGTIQDDSDFYPFGGERSYLSSSGNNYKFTGKERDAESGLDDFGARYLSSSLGRFTSPDSTSYSKSMNPQSLNLYAYAFNNPLIYVDPSGHEVSLSNCAEKEKCAAVLGKAAQLPTGVTAGVDKSGNLELKGDLSKIKGGNALRLLQLAQSKDKKVSFWIGDKAPGVDHTTQNVKGATSGLKSQGYDYNFAVVQSDPSKVDSGDLDRGAYLNSDGSLERMGAISGSNQEEAAAHELLGHVWAALFDGKKPGTEENKREALIAEDRIRNTDQDPAKRGLKIYHQERGSALVRESDLSRITKPGDKP